MNDARDEVRMQLTRFCRGYDFDVILFQKRHYGNGRCQSDPWRLWKPAVQKCGERLAVDAAVGVANVCAVGIAWRVVDMKNIPAERIFKSAIITLAAIFSVAYLSFDLLPVTEGWQQLNKA